MFMSMGRRPKDEMAALALTARAQIKRAEALGKSLDLRMAAKKDAAEDWIPDEDWRRDFASVTTVIQHAGNSLMRALEGSQKNLGNLTDAQLEAQFQAELVKTATSISDDDWEKMQAAREKKAR